MIPCASTASGCGNHIKPNTKYWAATAAAVETLRQQRAGLEMEIRADWVKVSLKDRRGGGWRHSSRGVKAGSMKDGW